MPAKSNDNSSSGSNARGKLESSEKMNEVSAYLPEKVNELGIKPENWRERWAISYLCHPRINNIWCEVLFPLLWAGFMTKMLASNESWFAIYMIWLAAGWMIDESIRGRAIKAIIMRINKEG